MCLYIVHITQGYKEGLNGGMITQGNIVLNYTEDARQMCFSDIWGQPAFIAIDYNGRYNHIGQSISSSSEVG